MSNKEFFVRHGLSVNNTVLTANVITNNVGIGTNNPTYTLDVIGNANISLPRLFVAGTNVLASLNSAYTISNAAYDSANSNWVVQNAVYDLANTIYASSNSNWVVQNAIYNLTNTVYASGNSNWEVQNLVYSTTNAAYTLVNTVYTISNSAFDTVNAVYASSNSNWVVQNLIYSTVNVSYTTVNVAYNTTNAAYDTINAVYASENSNWTVQNVIYDLANTIYASGNSNWVVQNSLYTVANAAFLRANAIVNVGQTAPVSPVLGNLWWDTDIGKLFIYYTDVDSSQWVEVEPSGTSGTTPSSANMSYGGTLYYGANVALSNSSVTYQVPINSSSISSYDVAIDGNNAITFSKTGVYVVTYSIEFENVSNTQDDVYIWFLINGQNLADSSSAFTVPARKSAQITGKLIACTPVMISVNSGDKLQVVTASPTGTGISMVTYPPTNNSLSIPRTPGVIIVITQAS